MTPYMIESELRAGEKMLWKGKPKGGLMLRASDIFLIPFSLVWGGGMLSGMFSNTANARNSAPPTLFLLPFAAIAVYLIIGRFFIDAMLRKKTEYALTNERAIIVSGFFQRKVNSVNLKTIPDYSVTEKKDGTGTIAFSESTSPYGKFSRGFNMPGMTGGLAFDMINDVRNVDSLIVFKG